MLRKILLLIALTPAFVTACQRPPPQNLKPNPRTEERRLADVIGATHVNGRYYFTDGDYLNEGADRVLEMGSRVIKVWFYGKAHEHPDKVYPYNSDWPTVDDLVEGARLPYWRQLFAKPLTTYLMCVTSMGRKDDYWLDGISDEQAADETRQFYELTRHFLTEYEGTGKTFVFQHWEGDWMTRFRLPQWNDDSVDPPQEVFDNMIRWLNARQAGVNQARHEFANAGVEVYHAAEVNRVVRSLKEGRPNMVNRVIPFTTVDMVSYSSYDSIFQTADNQPGLFGECLDFIKANLPPSAVFDEDSVYLGEFGVPENEFTLEQLQAVVRNAVETALDRNCPYIVYWQLYCNEPYPGVELPNWENRNYRGFWMIRPDGTTNWVYKYFQDLING